MTREAAVREARYCKNRGQMGPTSATAGIVGVEFDSSEEGIRLTADLCRARCCADKKRALTAKDLMIPTSWSRLEAHDGTRVFNTSKECLLEARTPMLLVECHPQQFQ